MTALIVPLLLAAACVYAALRGVDVFSALSEGAKNGLTVACDILPRLVILLTGIYMLRASTALDALTRLLSPLLSAVGIPEQTAPLMLLRPLSGSGALAAGSEIMERFSPDSYVGRCAAVMLGSTETTFYVLAVYFGASRPKNTRRLLLSAAAADIVGFMAAAFTVKLFF